MAKLVPAQVLKCEKPSLNRLGSFFFDALFAESGSFGLRLI